MTPEDRQKEIMSELWSLMPDGVKTPEAIRGLAMAMWNTGHNDGLDRNQMLDAFALLSGVATAVLLDYAKLLESQHAPA